MLIAHLSVAQAATITNAVSTLLQYSLELALSALLLYFMGSSESATTWSAATRLLHSSLWPTLLRTESSLSKGADILISIITKSFFLIGFLVSISSVITPLGLHNGPGIHGKFTEKPAFYIADSSPVGLATPPRAEFNYGRICGPSACPGNENTSDITQISSHLVNIFSSMPYGPFSMQYRQYFQNNTFKRTLPAKVDNMYKSFFLSDTISAVEGVIVDSTSQPGVSFLNHSFPNVDQPATWSQDLFWFEPVVSCIDVNITLDYRSSTPADFFDGRSRIINITDHGGYVHPSYDYGQKTYDGQNVNLTHAALFTALNARSSILQLLNLNPGDSYINKTTSLSLPSRFKLFTQFELGFPGIISLRRFQHVVSPLEPMPRSTMCMDGFTSPAGVENVSIHCSIAIGPPKLVNGHPNSSLDSTWRQKIHACASATRSKSQRVNFSFNGKNDLAALHLTREDIDRSALWALEKTDVPSSDVNLLWGPIADHYEHDPSIYTLRSHALYLPAGSVDIDDQIGLPSTYLSGTWRTILEEMIPLPYWGPADASILDKWESVTDANPTNSPALLLKLMWTDMVANNMMGSYLATSLMTATTKPSTALNIFYAFPIFLLLSLWLLASISAIIIVIGGLRLSHLRHLLNQTSVGRIVVGHSVLRSLQPKSKQRPKDYFLEEAKVWAKTQGKVQAAFDPSLCCPLEINSSEESILSPQGKDTGEASVEGHGFVFVAKSLPVSLKEFAQLDM